ncbi:acyl-CoA Delta(11) desaturase-like [Epargyreus clarus]|uniref:acyl-CoA Delta(11) desaturase-like n=1 Tax=Epargyreus clarus TaxID=520877 RepID=UPI003C2D1091
MAYKDGLPHDELDEMYEPNALLKPVTSRKYEIVYRNILTFSYAHAAALYGLYLCFTSAMWSTIFFNWVLFVLAELGITAGVHRLWTHRAYKAKMPLQIILMVMNSIAFQDSAITWVRDHRMHHKYLDTDADPYTTRRGYFFAHVGWLLVRKHPEVLRRGKTLDMSDIYGNPVLRFQKKYAIPFIGSICFLLPTLIPIYFWGETLNSAWHLVMLRYVINVNITFMVNSIAHSFGGKPYDSRISPTQSLFVSFAGFGEGFHNYHHVYPWDYRTAELGNKWLNLTTLFIDFFAWIGWAYDLKTVPVEVAKARALRTGDGTDEWGKRVCDDRCTKGSRRVTSYDF